MSQPGHHHLVMGLGRWAAARELAHILETFPGTYTHLFLADQHVQWEGCLRCVVDAVFGGQIMGTPYSCLLPVAQMADLMAV